MSNNLNYPTPLFKNPAYAQGHHIIKFHGGWKLCDSLFPSVGSQTPIRVNKKTMWAVYIFLYSWLELSKPEL